MSQNRFVGVAYWSVKTGLSNWLARAMEILAVLEVAQLAVLTYDCIPAGDVMSIMFGDEQCQFLINNGQGQGVVRASPAAGCFVVCLVALRKALGDVSVVTDGQISVPALPRQADPLFASDWLRVQKIAQELGLIRGENFAARHKSIFTHGF